MTTQKLHDLSFYVNREKTAKLEDWNIGKLE
jgi:hypothetical protein